MNKPKKMGFFTWLANLLGLGNKENSTSKTFKGQQSFNNETISTAPDESVDISDIISENFQKSNKMALVHNFQPDNNLSPKKTTRSFEEIGLLFGLANKANEKQIYLDSIDADISTTRSNLNEDIGKLKGQFNELLSSTKNIKKELRSLIDDLENNRNSTVIKLSKTIRALLMESDFDAVEKKEIINKVLDEGMSAVASVKESIIKSQKTIDEMINSFLAASPLLQINTLYERYLEELKEHQTAKAELQKGFAAGLAIKKNLDEIENIDNSQGDEGE